MELVVECDDGNRVVVGVEPDDTVADLQQRVEEQTGIPCAKQLLTFAGQRLDPRDALADSGLVGDTVVHVWTLLTDEERQQCMDYINGLCYNAWTEDVLEDLEKIYPGASGDEQVITECLKLCGRNFRHISGVYKNDKEFVLKVVGLSSYPYLPDHLRCDRDISRKVARSTTVPTRFLPDTLRHDADFMLSVPWSLDSSAPSLLADREFMLKAVEKRAQVLALAPPAIAGDREVVLRAVAKFGLAALQYADQQYLADREIILLAVSKVRYSSCVRLQSALFEDPDFMLEAVRRNPAALQLANGPLRELSHPFYKDALRTNARVYLEAPWKVKRDPALALVAVTAFPELIPSVPKSVLPCEMQTPAKVHQGV
eukprot:Sspe_Gene.115588::Locus_103209_Transcript_1_1_Confidence_1.000_Length_1329::g.115588::m.115588